MNHQENAVFPFCPFLDFFLEKVQKVVKKGDMGIPFSKQMVLFYLC
jgi:hypothetical protein